MAAAFGVAYRTAYHVLRSVAALQPGEELIVLGAGGGVGTAAVQLGAVLGATVTAVASTPEKLEAAARLRRAAPHRPPRRRPAPGPARRPARRRRRGRRPGRGRPGRAGPARAALRRPLRDRGLRVRDDPPHPAQPGAAQGRPHPRVPVPRLRRARSPRTWRATTAELLDLLAEGRAAPLIGADVRPGSEVVAALRHVAEGQAVGKVLVRVAPDRR